MIASRFRLVRRPTVALAICAVSAGSLIYTFRGGHFGGEQSNGNYKLIFSQPTGWRSLPHAPDVLFCYRHDARKVEMRAAKNDIVDEANPTPGLDADALAQQYSEVVGDRLPGWKAEVLDTVEGHGVKFRLLRRWRKDRCVVSAFGVRGNSTVIVALSASGEASRHLDGSLPEFRTYLAGLSFEPYIYPEL